MKREIRVVDHARGWVQATYPDERWYVREISADGTAENKRTEFVPSTSWIASYYPKDVRFYKWLAQRSWDESEEIKAMRGDQGSKVHQAAKVLLSGGTINTQTDTFENPRTLQQETLGPHEIECLVSLGAWYESEKPEIEIIAMEYPVWNEKHRYAGTIDLKCRLGKRTMQGAEGRRYTRRAGTYIIDFKISPEIWPSYELQISAYKHADSNSGPVNLAILQLGYKHNKKKKWKFTPIEDQFGMFLAVRKIWQKETAKVVPLQRDYPLELKLA